jgi:hypothetical protein
LRDYNFQIIRRNLTIKLIGEGRMATTFGDLSDDMKILMRTILEMFDFVMGQAVQQNSDGANQACTYIGAFTNGTGTATDVTNELQSYINSHLG